MDSDNISSVYSARGDGTSRVRAASLVHIIFVNMCCCVLTAPLFLFVGLLEELS